MLHEVLFDMSSSFDFVEYFWAYSPSRGLQFFDTRLCIVDSSITCVLSDLSSIYYSFVTTIQYLSEARRYSNNQR